MLTKMLIPQTMGRGLNLALAVHIPHQCTDLYSHPMFQPFSLHRCWPKQDVGQRVCRGILQKEERGEVWSSITPTITMRVT